MPACGSARSRASHRRASTRSVKNYHWLDLDMAQFDAYDHDAQMVVLRDMSGAITEGPGYNIFAFVDGRWLTPAGHAARRDTPNADRAVRGDRASLPRRVA